MFEGPASWSCVSNILVHQFLAVQKSHVFLVYSNSKYTVTLGDTPCLYDKHIFIFKILQVGEILQFYPVCLVQQKTIFAPT